MDLVEAQELVGEQDGLSADGFDDCIIGVAERCGQQPLLVYDAEKVIQKLMDQDGMDRDTAVEFYEFNVRGAWMGEGTPLWMTRIEGV